MFILAIVLLPSNSPEWGFCMWVLCFLWVVCVCMMFGHGIACRSDERLWENGGTLILWKGWMFGKQQQPVADESATVVFLCLLPPANPSAVKVCLCSKAGFRSCIWLLPVAWHTCYSLCLFCQCVGCEKIVDCLNEWLPLCFLQSCSTFNLMHCVNA